MIALRGNIRINYDNSGRRAADPLHKQHPGETGHTSGGQAGGGNYNSGQRNATKTLLWYQTLDVILLLINLFVKYCPIVGVSIIAQNCSNIRNVVYVSTLNHITKYRQIIHIEASKKQEKN